MPDQECHVRSNTRTAVPDRADRKSGTRRLVQIKTRRKQIGRFNHEKGCCSYDEETFDLPASKTEDEKDDRQSRAGEFGGHGGTARQTCKNVAVPRRIFVSFPEKIKGENREHRYWN